MRPLCLVESVAVEIEVPLSMANYLNFKLIKFIQF